jgi:hypothetical protein
VAVSATLCAASANIAAEPVSTPATSLSTPIPAFAPSATRTVSVLSPPWFSGSGLSTSATARG